MKYLLFIVFLSACGSSGGGDSGGTVSERKVTATPVSTSYYVATSSKLVACDGTTKGFLAYVQDAAQFMACLDAGWSVVNVSGKDGVSGSNGKDGKDGQPVSANQWYDIITQKMWVMTTIVTSTVGWDDSVSACTGNYRMATGAEISLALTHGMKAVAQALVSPPTLIIATGGNTYNVSNGVLNNTGSGAQFCIAK